MKAYKGFNKDLKCRDFQYEIGKTYTIEKASLCNYGFHACLYPLDVFNYYSPANSRFCVVELDGITDESSNDSKVCGTSITIVKEISLQELAACAIDYALDKVDTSNNKSNTGDRSLASNTGNYSSASNTGSYSSASNTGYCSLASNTGNYSSASNTGSYSSASVAGKDSVAAVFGYKSKAKACLGSAICIVERGDWNGETYPLISIKSAIIDGEVLKPDTYYTVKNGEFVEVKEG